MFKIIGAIIALILAIICGNKIGDAINSGLVGFVGGLICFAVLLRIALALGMLFDEGVGAAKYRMHRRQYYGKSKWGA